MKFYAFGLAALAATVLAVGGTTADDTKRKDDKPFDDVTFVKKAASGGMHEVELGKLAQSQASNDLVRKFGERMVTDHTKANADLKTVAEAMGVTLPAKMMDEHQKEFDRFKGMSGADFDRAYVDHMVKDHEEDVAMFKRATTEAKDAKLKEFATKTLPTLEDHLKTIQDIQKQIKK